MMREGCAFREPCRTRCKLNISRLVKLHFLISLIQFFIVFTSRCSYLLQLLVSNVGLMMNKYIRPFALNSIIWQENNFLEMR